MSRHQRLQWILLCAISFNAGFYVNGLLTRDRIRAGNRRHIADVESAIRYCVESGLLVVNEERLRELEGINAPLHSEFSSPCSSVDE